MRKTTTCRIKSEDVSRLIKIFPTRYMSEAITAILDAYDERISKKDMLSYIDSRFKINTEVLEKKIKAVLGEF